MALLLVLACIVLIAILIVSFISFSKLNRLSTASYSKSIQAQEIAQGGLQDILGDLHTEIVAGSTTYTTGTGSYATAYIPNTNFTAVPARLGYTAGSWTNDYQAAYFAPTLIRVSRASQDGTPTHVYPAYNTTYYTGTLVPLNRASAASTTNSYNGGSYISVARWNKTYLLATNSAGVPTPFVNSPPDWVYVTRTGSRVCNASEMASLKPSSNLTQSYTITAGANPPASPVVGRYAFVMYDEGALLDINAAGSPSTLITGSAPVLPPPSYTNSITGGIYTLPGKSYVTSADLTQLPGLSGAQTPVDNLVKWRNAGSISSVGTSGSNFLQIMMTYAANGFLSFTSGDNPILGRQDLINYFANIDPNINTTSATYSKALPYLGTFSRAFNAPSWYPTLDSNLLPGYAGGSGTSIVKYNTNMESTGNANRDLANVRFSAAGTVQHYNDSGVASSYSVNTGDPLLQHRFSLAKLGWIGHNGATGTITATAIQSCFGLAWNSSANRWDYYGSTASSAASSIETLDQVATESREPNFFELLKAGILSGSLGKNPGASGITLSPSPSYIEGPNKIEGSMGYDFDSYSNIPDFQIIQIGVNIIDQSRSDNYPTSIYLNFTPPRTYTSEGPLFQTAFGIKNLPYLTRMGMITAVTSGPASGTPPPYDVISSWLQPEIWNPNQNPYSTYPGTVAPAQLRLVTYGESYALNTVDAQKPASPQNPGTPVTFGDDPSNPATAGEIYFGNSSTFFGYPVPLTDAYAGTTATPAQNVWPTTASGCLVTFSGVNQFYGVFTGSVQRIPPTSGGTANRVRIIPDPQLTFELEYYDGINWLPYSMMSRVVYMGTQSFASANTNGSTGWKEFAARPDPRTDRFSVSEGEAQGGNAPQYWGMSASSKGLTIQWDNITSVNNYGSVRFGYPLQSSGFVYSPTVSPTVAESSSENQYFNMWAQNQSSPLVPNPNASLAYYVDPDGVIRPGDSFRENLASGAGVMLNYLTTPSGVTTYNATGRRPVILDRPFRSVGELGYVFRDLPFRTIDFWSNNSADAALLDLFSVTDEPQVVAGHVNPTNAPVPVLQAIILGAMKNDSITPNLALSTSDTTTSTNDTQTMATTLANQFSTLPLRNRADLVAALSNAITANLTLIPDLANKAYGETSLRALSSVTNTRTWNLLIDIIAQSGQMSPTANASDTNALSEFVVQGEKRYWLHIAIDRYTGKIIDQQLESVYE